ncbi:MAG: RIP metalloprotease RseP [Clostridiales bacterium]|nr:RIP metalloprotease RseP [Clostridiales bacterium]
MKILYVMVALLVFGILIFIHELGHYIMARMFGVTIYEFALGMGPKVLSFVSKKTGIRYSIRLLPVGGYVNMAGEDEESEDPNALNKKPAWQRFIIIASGSLMNLFCGILVMFLLVCSTPIVPSATIHSYPIREGTTVSSEDSGLMPGDRIIKVGNVRVHIGNQVVYEIMRNGIKPIDITVQRGDEIIVIPDVAFPTESYNGQTIANPDFKLKAEARSVVNILKHTYFRSTSTVKMIWKSLFDLITGRYGFEAVSGPVGLTDAIGSAAKQSFPDLVHLSVVISMNLGIFNLLPIPALDGSRLIFILVEMIRRKPINPKHEGYVHFVGIIVLLSLMLLVTFKDIAGLIR